MNYLVTTTNEGYTIFTSFWKNEKYIQDLKTVKIPIEISVLFKYLKKARFIYVNNSFHIGYSKIHSEYINGAIKNFCNLYPASFDLIGCPYYPEFNAPLHKYQRENISWLLELEKNHTFEYDNKDEIISVHNNSITINKFTGKFIGDIKTSGSINIPCAFLCDNVGYGKTISALTYIANSPGKTMIIVHRRLMQQWEDEIKKYLPDLKYIAIYTASSYNKYELDMKSNNLKHNILLVNESFIFGKPYSYTDQAFHLIEWDRIVIDEIHELKSEHLKSLPKHKFMVGLTATPKYETWDACVPFILNDMLIAKHFRRTDTSINIPPYVRNVVKLEFSPVESALYNVATSDDDKYKICTSSTLAVDGDICEVMLKSLSAQILNIESIIKDNNEKIELVKHEPEKYKYRLNRARELEVRLNNTREHIINFKNIKPSTSCSICGRGNPQYISPFGHQYCSDCIAIFADEFTDISGNTIKKTELAFNAAWGTKFTYIYEYVQSHTDEKILIFTRYESILNEIKHMLNHYAIKSRVCKGNVYQIRNIIDEFKKGAVNVLLLSSERSNSGFDLVEVSKIILVDYMTEDIEKQAIGRAHRMGQTKTVEIIKLIIQNSIEDK